jgi:hypothetical protein
MPTLKHLEEDIEIVSTSGLFDAPWYAQCCGDDITAKTDPARHYVLYGEKEGRPPNPELNLDRYLAEIGPDALNGHSLLAHYISHRDPERQIDIINRSGLFDRTWYIAQNPDVRDSKIDPVKHYVYYGMQEGRRPNPDIEMENYTRIVTAKAGITENPLIRYILTGKFESDYAIIEKSGLFDGAWYLQKYPDLRASGIDPLKHYILYGEKEHRQPNKKLYLKQYALNVKPASLKGKNVLVHYILFGKPEDFIDPGILKSFSLSTLKLAIERLRHLPVFDPEDYLELNSDVGAAVKEQMIDPVNHALAYGIPEGRRVLRSLRVAQVLGECARRPLAAPSRDYSPKDVPALGPIAILYNSAGNVFLRELAQELVDALQFIGLSAALFDETTDPDTLPPVTVIVAPHEFFHIGEGKKWVTDKIVRNAYMYNTEQPQTLWFERALPFILASRGVIDICVQIADLFEQSGVPSLHFNPNATVTEDWLFPEDLSHPFYRILPKAAKPRPDAHTPFNDRPIDLSFFGTASRRREAFFSKNAKFLANHPSFLYYRKFTGPLTANSRDGILSRIGRHVTAHSKISLNIHRDDLGFFEWHRLVKLGMLGGSIVVTEPCLPHPVFKPGIHYLEDASRHFPDLIEWLVNSSEGQAHARTIQENIFKISDPSFSFVNSLALAKFISAHGDKR